MALSDDLHIERLATGLLARTLPKAEWTHEAHFAAALWLLRYRPDLTRADEIRRLISGYNEATGTANTDEGGYHHSITLASMRAARHHLASHGPDAPLHHVLRLLMASPQGHPGWLAEFWREETLFSVAARRTWVEPDLAPLPF
ncbi:hypothetical protein [Sphingobium sp. SYK-6]|uniref:hypothetical protein n=1 Tax=Sphingobium sp. (strain NBRC 103272 / SYK-6) TaxID=627192 RepID=UPI0002D8BC30|nr:hypothetical protein [Sphingobium sp. SYK-6]